MESIESQHNGIDVRGACSAGSCRSIRNHIHRGGAVIVFACIHKRNPVVGLHIPAEIVLAPVIVAGPAGAAAHTAQHLGVHQQHRRSAVERHQEAVQFVQEGIAVGIHLRGTGQAHGAGDLIGGTGQQLLQAIKGVGHIARAACGRGAIDDEIMEIVAGRFDFLLSLKCQFIHCAGGVLQNAVHLEGAAHDDGVGGLFLPLSLIGRVFTVNRTHRSCTGGLKLNITVGQR